MIRFIPFFICLVLFSCKKDIDDLEKPVIANLATSTEEVSINSSFNILLLVKDNMSLSAVKLTVYPSFYFADDTSFSKKRFNYSYVEETNESKVNLSIPLTINDSTATGIYTIEAQAVDKKGNTSEKVYKTFKIISSINAPSINVSFPVSGGSYNSSDTLNFTGTITDNEAIKQIAIVSTQEDFWSNTASFSYDTTVISSWDFQLNGGFSLVLPSTSGETQSVIYAIDTVGNQSSKSISYQVN